jgi:hypothetical protein
LFDDPESKNERARVEFREGKKVGPDFSLSGSKISIVRKIGDDPFLFAVRRPGEFFVNNSRRALLDQEIGNRLLKKGMNIDRQFNP